MASVLLELDVPADAVNDDLAEQMVSVAELRHEMAEPVPGIAADWPARPGRRFPAASAPSGFQKVGVEPELDPPVSI